MTTKGTDTGAADLVVRRFRFFAATQCQDHSPLYEALSSSVAEDPDLCDLMVATPEEQRRPALLLAVVHWLLSERTDHPLADFYPSLGGTRPPDDGAAAAFRSFCVEHRDPITALLADAKTQTNEVRRAASLLVALHQVHSVEERPVALIEVGASAGLNLLFDRYEYGSGGSPTDSRAGLVRMDPDIHGPHAPAIPSSFPPVPIRVGLDLAPVDIDDADALRWLRAFVWPDLIEDRARLDAALALARRQPPTVLQGDALRDLPELIAGTPSWATPCCFHATLMTYLGSPERERIFASIREAAEERTVAWIYLEAAALMRGTGGPGGISSRLDADTSHFTLGVVVSGPGRRPYEHALARVEPYGRRIDWLGGNAPPAYPVRSVRSCS